MDDADLLDVLDAAAAAVGRASTPSSTGVAPAASRGQYDLDLAADAAAVEVLLGAGLGVLSEESRAPPPRARRLPWSSTRSTARPTPAGGIPWFATSLAAVDADGLRAALVVNQATGVRYEAVRGGGAAPRRRADLEPSSCRRRWPSAIVAMNGWPPRAPRLAASSERSAPPPSTCAWWPTARSTATSTAPSTPRLVGLPRRDARAAEAGGVVADARDRPLVAARSRRPADAVAAATPELHAAVAAAELGDRYDGRDRLGDRALRVGVPGAPAPAGPIGEWLARRDAELPLGTSPFVSSAPTDGCCWCGTPTRTAGARRAASSTGRSAPRTARCARCGRRRACARAGGGAGGGRRPRRAPRRVVFRARPLDDADADRRQAVVPRDRRGALVRPGGPAAAARARSPRFVPLVRAERWRNR